MGIIKRRVAEQGEGCCFDCMHYVFKILMGLSFETGHRADGICHCENNNFYYTSGSFTCPDHTPRRTWAK